MLFNYVAYTLENGLFKGKIEADTEGEARGEVVRQGYKILRLSPARSIPGLEQMFPSIFKVKTGELVRFSRQMATMVRGGSSLQRGLEMLESETRNRVMRRVLGDVRKMIDQGGSLSGAFAKYPNVFSTRYTSIVEVGEHTGSLADSLEQLADALAREHEAVQKFKRTMMMPAFTMGASLAMLVLMMTVMLPPLLEAFEGRGTDVPLITRIAMAVINAFESNLIYIGSAIVIIAVTVALIRRIPRTQFALHLWMTRLPIVGNLIVTREMAQFSRTNAMLLQAGVSLARSLPLAISGCKNLALLQAFNAGEESLMSGHGFASAVGRYSVMPRLWVELVSVGEENNVIGTTLSDLATAYEKEVENKLESIIALLEPASTFVVGGVVLFIALSMFLPIYSGMEDLG
ncbi:MAG: type II secretion system F family protein [SAR202 cluster bacterium]|nr:type II secretion system F family protein [SAR202 cluster bacterium]